MTNDQLSEIDVRLRAGLDLPNEDALVLREALANAAADAARINKASRDALRNGIASWLESPEAQEERRKSGIRGFEGMARMVREGAGSRCE